MNENGEKSVVQSIVEQLIENVSKNENSQSFSANKAVVGYVYSEQLLKCVSCLPKVKGRALLVDGLIRAFGLHSKMKLLLPVAATDCEMRSFHSEEYLNYIRRVTQQIASNSEFFADDGENDFGLSYDCAPIPHLYEIVSQIAGSSLRAAKAIVSQDCKIAINWFGGWHHAHRDEASGFCYVNDIVLAILYLLSNGYKRILYIDLDLHHGDGVEAAFAHSSKVMTVSLHKHEVGFFPGTGGIKDNGFNNINVPLKDGIDDETYVCLFKKVIQIVKSRFDADAVICQCGGDTLVGDPFDCFNLTLHGIGNCVQLLISSFDTPFIFFGGGGYNILNVSRLWTYLTSIILGVHINNQIPDHSNFLLYRPSYELHIEKSSRKNLNDSSYLNSLLNTLSDSNY
ncbi:hypothetical protein B4U79_14045 [Dinothrombium tinctorium]|uniref:Histone deacetylase n=1 Tax=Dinothrombium tinctorium TaxID=1965070 RepID=A0A3S3QKJ2_9ACAR|nr:hypothetical protein B4U79_14045 [Dinothrombium tinctorium]